MYGWLKFDAGCSLNEIDAMTLHDVRRFSNYAKKNPSLRALAQMVALALGVEFKEKDESKPVQSPTFEQMQQLMKQTGGRVPGMGSPYG